MINWLDKLEITELARQQTHRIANFNFDASWIMLNNAY